jgi:hypothetical protein
MTAPFPLPAHQTGRAGFPHPAFRLASSHGTRRRAEMDTPEVEHPEPAEDRAPGDGAGSDPEGRQRVFGFGHAQEVATASALGARYSDLHCRHWGARDWG